MFINYKIFYENYHFLGATGIALKTSYVNEMLSFFRKQYNFNVYFVDKDGEVSLSETGVNNIKNINDIKELKQLKDDIFDINTKTIEYERDGYNFLLNTKYVKELDLYLIVEAKVENFTQEVKKTFYMNLFISLVVTFLVILIILYTIKSYNRKFEHLASHDALTSLPNRRTFNENFEKILALYSRNKKDTTMVFFDIDNFKRVNDTFGHQVGDKVLIRISELIKKSIRKSDYVSRWGGEEFSILLNNICIEDTKTFVLKFKNNMETDELLRHYTKDKVTASFGITAFKEDDTMDLIVGRVDAALYEAKNNGKNQLRVH